MDHGEVYGVRSPFEPYDLHFTLLALEHSCLDGNLVSMLNSGDLILNLDDQSN